MGDNTSGRDDRGGTKRPDFESTGSGRQAQRLQDKLDSFLHRYPVDERAMDYLNSCWPEVIERVVREFVPKQEGDRDYSAIITSFTKRIRGEVSQDQRTQSQLESFLDRYPVDERAMDYLYSCEPEVIER